MNPLSQHLRELVSRPDAWAVLARNLIPVVGIYGFGWSAALAVFNYWFDGLSALAAIVATLIPRALRETQPKSAGAISVAANIVRGVVTWIFLVGIVGLPYWIVLIPLHDLLLGDELRRQLAHSPALWFTFGSLAAGHFWKAFQSGYDTMPDKELKQRVRWDVYLLVLRAIAMFIMAAHGLAFILVPLMARCSAILRSGPGARSVRCSAIRRGCTNTIRTILRRAGADTDVDGFGKSACSFVRFSIICVRWDRP
jgi:hypothetical protein